jgi:hypothetical protein
MKGKNIIFLSEFLNAIGEGMSGDVSPDGVLGDGDSAAGTCRSKTSAADPCDLGSLQLSLSSSPVQEERFSSDVTRLADEEVTHHPIEELRQFNDQVSEKDTFSWEVRRGSRSFSCLKN